MWFHGFSCNFCLHNNKLFVFESYSWNPKFVLKELSLFLSARIANRFNRNLRCSFPCQATDLSGQSSDWKVACARLQCHFLLYYLTMYSANLLFLKKIKQKLNINTKSVGALHNRFPVDFFLHFFVFRYTICLQNLLNFLLFGTISNKVYVAFFRIIQ